MCRTRGSSIILCRHDNYATFIPTAIVLPNFEVTVPSNFKKKFLKSILLLCWESMCKGTLIHHILYKNLRCHWETRATQTGSAHANYSISHHMVIKHFLLLGLAAEYICRRCCHKHWPTTVRSLSHSPPN